MLPPHSSVSGSEKPGDHLPQSLPETVGIASQSPDIGNLFPCRFPSPTLFENHEFVGAKAEIGNEMGVFGEIHAQGTPKETTIGEFIGKIRMKDPLRQRLDEEARLAAQGAVKIIDNHLPFPGSGSPCRVGSQRKAEKQQRQGRHGEDKDL